RRQARCPKDLDRTLLHRGTLARTLSTHGREMNLPRTHHRFESQKMPSRWLRTKHLCQTCLHLLAHSWQTEPVCDAALKLLGGCASFHEKSQLIHTRLCPLAPHRPPIRKRYLFHFERQCVVRVITEVRSPSVGSVNHHVARPLRFQRRQALRPTSRRCEIDVVLAVELQHRVWPQLSFNGSYVLIKHLSGPLRVRFADLFECLLKARIVLPGPVELHRQMRIVPRIKCRHERPQDPHGILPRLPPTDVIEALRLDGLATNEL